MRRIAADKYILRDLCAEKDGWAAQVKRAAGELAGEGGEYASSARIVLKAAEEDLRDLQNIPQTTYSLYRDFAHTGERHAYQTPYFRKRTRLSAAVLHLLFGNRKDLLRAVCDYIWSICEESNWVIPAHERLKIDLFAAETSFMLAEIVHVLENPLPQEIIARVREEIEQRIFAPYLTQDFHWHKGESNWNGVCNSSIGAAFLHLEQDEERLAKALRKALDGLDVYIDTAFEEDGGSTEGTGYWQYGLMNYICFSELLRERSGGKLDLLGSERMKRIAAFPLHMMLSDGHFASFADCRESLTFHPGIISRLAERTGTKSLVSVLAPTPLSVLRYPRTDRFPIMLRNILWWDGQKPAEYMPEDTYLRCTGVAKIVVEQPTGDRLVLAAKAGHNEEKHNHNDVGSFILHIEGETFICDPGLGLYTRDYFSSRRYENVFCNSFGHSVPRINGNLQRPGREFCGKILSFESNRELKRIVIEFAEAYGLSSLRSLRRILEAPVGGKGVTLLEDTFIFDNVPAEVEEGFITYLPVKCRGSTLYILGQRKMLELHVQEPDGLSFSVRALEGHLGAEGESLPLKRLAFSVKPQSDQFRVRVLMKVIRRVKDLGVDARQE